jgi:hypothetical protein
VPALGASARTAGASHVSPVQEELQQTRRLPRGDRLATGGEVDSRRDQPARVDTYAAPHARGGVPALGASARTAGASHVSPVQEDDGWVLDNGILRVRVESTTLSR